MANPIIKIKRSAVPGKIPTTISLPTGEFAINTYDGKVYIQQEQVGIGSTVVAINPWSVGVGSNTYNTYFTAGNVGIGSTVPSSALSVVGDGNFSGVVTAIAFYGDGSNLTGISAGITTATYTENSFVATAGQSSFSVSYEVGYVDVFLNGIRLSSSEYTATNGSTVVLDDAATEGDVVDIIEVATYRGLTGPAGETTLAGVATTSSSTTHYPLFVAGLGTTEPFITTTSNYFSFIPESGTLAINQLNVIGVATATDFNSTSDIHLKTNIKSIDDPLAKVIQLNGVSFDWKHMNQSSAGVIAQDVEKVLPEIVKEAEDGYKTLNYNGLIGLLIEAVKEQNETIKSLEQKINNLEERLN